MAACRHDNPPGQSRVNRTLVVKLPPDRIGPSATERILLMSLTRRLAAGLPAAGVTAFAALAFAGTPAMAATADAASTAVRPALMATPCTHAPRADCTYSTAVAPVPGVITTS